MGVLKGLGFGMDIVKARLLRRRVPFLVQFSITNHCNARCNYCNYYEQYEEEMTTKEIFSILDQLAELGTKRINIYGGEPLVRKDIGQIIDYVRSRGMGCALISNGYLVPARINEIKNLTKLNLSLDGTREANDANREKGSFDKVMRAIEVATRAGIPLMTNFPLTQYNVHPKQIDFLLNLAEKYNYKVSILLLKLESVVSSDAKNFVAGDEDLRRALRKIISEKKKGRPVLLSRLAYEYCLRWPDYGKDRIEADDSLAAGVKGPRCWAGRYHCVIDPNGDLYPCSVVNYGGVPHLNALEVGVKKAFEFAGEHNCLYCSVPSKVETNYMFSLRPSVLINVAWGF